MTFQPVFVSGPQPAPQWLRVHPELVKRIRTTSVLVGLGSVLLSPILGIAAVVLGVRLPISDHPITYFSVILVATSALATWSSGIAMMGGPTYAKIDRMNLSVARRARRIMGACWVLAIVFGTLAFLNLMMIARTSLYQDEQVMASVLSYMLLQVALIALSGANSVVGRGLFRPSDKLLRRYGPHHASRPW